MRRKEAMAPRSSIGAALSSEEEDGLVRSDAPIGRRRGMLNRAHVDERAIDSLDRPEVSIVETMGEGYTDII
jgi:hypothetical protein